MRTKNTNRATSIYAVTVWFTPGEPSKMENELKRFSLLFGDKLNDISSYPTEGRHLIKVSWRSTDDRTALAEVDRALRKAGWNKYPAELHTGYGAHRRLVGVSSTTMKP